MNNELREQIQRYLDDGLDEAGRAELQTSLNTSREARQMYVTELKLHAALRIALRREKENGLDLAEKTEGLQARRGPVLWQSWRRAPLPGIAAAACLLVGLGLWGYRVWNQPTWAETSLMVTGVHKNGVVLPAGSGAMGVGNVFHVGDLVRTETGMELTLAYPDESRITVCEDTQVVLGNAGGCKQLRIESGEIIADVKLQPVNRPMVVLTAEARAEVVGTRFLVSDDGIRSRLVVEEGTVRFGAGDAIAEVQSGQFADVRGGVSSPLRGLQELNYEDGRGMSRIAWPDALLQSLELNLGSGFLLKMVLIPAGEFLMNPAQVPNVSAPQDRVRRVKISKPFYMGIYEVTQAQYEKVMGRNPSGASKNENAPVDSVKWHDAVVFCEQLSALTGYKVRLPTEAQWEYACRAGTDTLFSFDENREEINDYAWGSFNTTGDYTHLVGLLKPNAWGLYDMHGNVNEWCGDWYAPYSEKAVVDPQGALRGTARVYRGGSFHSAMPYSGTRMSAPLDLARRLHGFRVVVLVE